MMNEIGLIISGVILGVMIGLVFAGVMVRCPSGIGGFVYQEIEWADQTYNVMKENCDSGIFYSEDKKQLMCWKNDCTKDGYCKMINYYFPVLNVGGRNR